MDQVELEHSLKELPVSQIYYYKETGSTNDDALALIESGAPDGVLVIADSQTKGRGRFDRRWLTPPESALAFSLILRPTPAEQNHLALFAPLAGVAVQQALQKMGLDAKIKWPNDVLLNRRKTCGILTEAFWQGEQLNGVVIGTGINVASDSVPPGDLVQFPATSVESALGSRVNRLDLLHDVLAELFRWRPMLGGLKFLQTWEENLAFRGEAVQILPLDGERQTGILQGIDLEGNIILKDSSGKLLSFSAGDVHLRPGIQ